MSGERWEDPHGKLRGDLDFIARFSCRWSQFLAFVSKKKSTLERVVLPF